MSPEILITAGVLVGAFVALALDLWTPAAEHAGRDEA